MKSIGLIGKKENGDQSKEIDWGTPVGKEVKW